MVVRPGERMCGVGRLMMNAVEDLAREHGHDRLWVATGEGDADFYRHCGWGDEPLGDGSGDAARVLSKELPVVA
jgi:GNAT superfamily N-acetyltransferase